ncbi:MAG TPA: hypothetical protein VN693_06120 [Rhodanobacteraceae bacterium]|nr:hypothetical protein [Rhodanobacteraceae bacterium]
MTSALRPANKFWLFVRLVILVATACSAPYLYNLGHADFDKYGVSIKSILLLAGFCVFGIVFVIFIQYLNPYSADKWQKPSLFSNFYDYRQPIQIFHFEAWMLGVLALSMAIYTVLIGSHSMAFLFFLTIAIGTYLGTRLSMWLFKDKFSTDAGS